MALITDYPLNRLASMPESTAVQTNAYIVIEPRTLRLSPIPMMVANIYSSKTLYESGTAIPITSETLIFAVINNVNEGILPIPTDGKTYVVDPSDNTTYIAFQNREDGIVDIEATAYLYLQKLLGGAVK